MSVSGFTTMRAFFQSNILASAAIVNRVALSVRARRLLTLDEKGQLLTEKEIPGGEGTPRTDEIPSEREGVEDNGHNIREQTQERTFPRSE